MYLIFVAQKLPLCIVLVLLKRANRNRQDRDEQPCKGKGSSQIQRQSPSEYSVLNQYSYLRRVLQSMKLITWRNKFNVTHIQKVILYQYTVKFL